jgi:hypothetical protein
MYLFMIGDVMLLSMLADWFIFRILADQSEDRRQSWLILYLFVIGDVMLLSMLADWSISGH